MSKPTKINTLTLVGWGGMAGGELSITFKGPMKLAYEDGGAVVVATAGDVTAPAHTVKSLRGDVYVPAHSRKDIDKVCSDKGHLATAPFQKANRATEAAYAKRLTAAGKDLPADTHDRMKTINLTGILPKGRTFLVHLSHIRLAG